MEGNIVWNPSNHIGEYPCDNFWTTPDQALANANSVMQEILWNSEILWNIEIDAERIVTEVGVEWNYPSPYIIFQFFEP